MNIKVLFGLLEQLRWSLLHRVLGCAGAGENPVLAWAYGPLGECRGGRFFISQAGGDRSSHAGSRGAVSGAATEDAGSVEKLYRKYGASLYWVCVRYTGSKEDAEDMVQQVFMKVQKNLDSFRGQSNVYTWIYRITINECLNLFRQRKFIAEGNPEDLEHLVPVFPERQMDAKLDLQRIMAETDPSTVEILFLLYMEGLTQEDVAETLGISRTTINRKVAAFKTDMGRFR
jgi:RNA polymerase sigma-70 factor, ECF subfamily